MAYNIKAPEQRYLEVYVGDSDKPKKVPLADSLPAPWLIRINHTAKLPEDERGRAWFELYYDLFRHYVGPEVDAMTSKQLNELAEAWEKATEEQDGTTPGE